MGHTIITYDIFQLAKDLKKSKIPEEAIDALIKFEKAKDEGMLDTLVTKQDFKKDLSIVKRDIILTLVVLIPTILKILEHLKI